MGPDRIVCLANSYKHDHRCVAGISLNTKHLVRLVGRKVPGCLTVQETCFPDGREVALLDVFEAELGEACGSNCHPEDIYVAEKRWLFLRRFDGTNDAQFLTAYLSKEPILLQGYCDRIDVRRFKEKPAQCSLGIIHPEDLWWWVREEGGKRKNRALFRLGHMGRVRYDLPVTDPTTLNMLNLLPVGLHPSTLLCGKRTTRTIFTISLSEPFDGFHYKLVAGVINLPG